MQAILTTDDGKYIVEFNIDEFIQKLNDDELFKLQQADQNLLNESANYYDGQNEEVSEAMEYIRKLDSSTVGFKVRLCSKVC